MQPLALALRGSSELISQGLRTLELCIDNLTPDFLDPTLNTVLRDLMEALHDLLKPFHRSDAQIEADLRDLLAEPLRVPEKHEAAASVSQGVVTLRGTTRFPSDIGVLVAVASRVPGVIAVENCLRAREQEADPATASLP